MPSRRHPALPQPRVAPPGACNRALALQRATARRARDGVISVRNGARQLAGEVGQGTVEYVGLLLLMATLLAAIVGAASQLGGKDQIGKKVVTQIGKSIDKAGQGER
jgi:hypothetical protein